MAKTRRVFTLETKREAVRQATQPGNTIARFSRELGVHESVLRRWIQELASDSATPMADAVRSDEQSAELARLKHQVTQQKIARETVATALRSFCTSPSGASDR
ncbi:transposase [Polaromonas sp. YR568]|uniref:transposase n=1 Tax=Polaromonas sp. YR568 TaxID=1855301 RepID=UPI00210F4072|nr:transposase [Polaromonas sp. YR568]